MLIALLFFLVVALLMVVIPAVLLGLVAGRLTVRQTLPARTGVLLLLAAAQSTGWVLLLPNGYLELVTAFLVVLATLASGAGGVAWANHRSRPAWYYHPTGQPYWPSGAGS
ncbi:hypothetical protein ACIRPK_09785 [Kitasatospora sp. NPDC101801]|uniref:hypothetical protein n=1 Tax=Kitasatospora sp. NPDC101801 TaxID=3364103 RepID=UPI0038284240